MSPPASGSKSKPIKKASLLLVSFVAYSLTLKLEPTCAFRVLVDFQRTSRHISQKVELFTFFVTFPTVKLFMLFMDLHQASNWYHSFAHLYESTSSWQSLWYATCYVSWYYKCHRLHNNIYKCKQRQIDTDVITISFLCRGVPLHVLTFKRSS